VRQLVRLSEPPAALVHLTWCVTHAIGPTSAGITDLTGLVINQRGPLEEDIASVIAVLRM